MRYVWFALNWFFGIVFAFAGLSALFDSVLMAIPLFAIALLLLPPAREFAFKQTQKEVSIKARAISIFLLLAVFGVMSGQTEEAKMRRQAEIQAQEKAAQAEKEASERKALFSTNRAQILDDIRAAIDAKNYQEAVSLASKYAAVGDSELNELSRAAKESLAKVRRAEKTSKLLAQLKGIPEKEVEKIKGLYEQLAGLHPDNRDYKSQLVFYTEKFEEQKAKEQMAAEPEGSPRISPLVGQKAWASRSDIRA